MSGHEQLFSELETVEHQVAPEWLIALTQKAQEYEAILNQLHREGVTGIQLEEAVEQCIRELDAEYRFNNQVIRVTGMVTQSVYDHLENRYDTFERFADGELVVARGFYAKNTTKDVSVGEYEIGHYFEPLGTDGRVAQEPAPLTRIDVTHNMFARLAAIDIEYKPTNDERNATLASSLGGYMDTFDKLVLNSRDACDAVRQLRGMSFDFRTEDITEEVVEQFVEYAMECLRFDNELPYVVDMQGFIRGVDSEGQASIGYVNAAPMRVIARVDGMTIAPVAEKRDNVIHESDDMKWHLRLFIYPDTAAEEGYSVDVPVRSVRYMQSLRGAVYGER